MYGQVYYTLPPNQRKGNLKNRVQGVDKDFFTPFETTKAE
jgi:hypothetical protein